MVFTNGQVSIWADYLDREFLNGEFKQLVDKGIVTGITSNPAIFATAFQKGIYKDEVAKISKKVGSEKEIFKTIGIKELQRACDILLPIYHKTGGWDGYASIEVDPNLIEDWKGTVEEGLELWNRIGRPNLMIKIPANSPGYRAMEILSQKGVNINATLVFSPTQALQAYKAISAGKGRGVISIFVSRFDRKLNPILRTKGLATDRIGFFNGIKIYNLIRAEGTEQIRPLFASTGVKQEGLPVDYYVRNLYLPEAILTLPLEVLNRIIGEELEESFLFQTKHIDAFFGFLTPAGINLSQIYSQLFKEGVEAFQTAFAQMLERLKES